MRAIVGTFLIVTFVVCLVIMPLAGGLLTSRARRLESAQRAIAQRPVVAIAALREGEPARIRGVVAACEPLLTSAIGGRECIGYRSMIDDQSHDPDYDWDGVVKREEWPSFLVTDETGTVAVQGQLRMQLGPSEFGMSLPPRALALLKADDVRMRDLFRPREFYFRETVLKPGDRVNVIGRPSRAIGAVGGPSPPLVMRGIFDQPVVVSDDDIPAGVLTAGARAAPLQLEAPRARGPSRGEIQRRETIAVAALRDGEPAKIQGVAAVREPLVTSPVSGRACIGYRVVIERVGHGSPLVVGREAWPSFLIKDDTGTAAVQGPFSILLDPDDGGWAALPPAVYALLEEANVPLSDGFGREQEFRFKETLLEPGDRVSVVGRPALEIDPAGQGSSRSPPGLFVLRGSDEEPVAVTEDKEPAG